MKKDNEEEEWTAKETTTSRSFQSSNVPKPPKLSRGTITKIDFGPNAAEIDRIWSGKVPTKLIEHWRQMGYDAALLQKHYNPGSMKARYSKSQKLVGYGSNKIGYCSVCKSNLNKYILRQKIQGATIVTRFCSEHVPDVIKKV